jgi:hypothetical protein
VIPDYKQKPKVVPLVKHSPREAKLETIEERNPVRSGFKDNNYSEDSDANYDLSDVSDSNMPELPGMSEFDLQVQNLIYLKTMTQEIPKKPVSKIVTLSLGSNQKDMDPCPYSSIEPPLKIQPKHKTLKEKEEVNEFDICSLSSISSDIEST